MDIKDDKLEKEFLNDFFKEPSHKLLLGYQEEKIKLSPNFLCNICLGIVIDPINCVACNYSICKKCFDKSKHLSAKCNCIKPDIANFVSKEIIGIQESYYLISKQQDCP